MVDLWKNYWSDESGQGLVEYVLIVALVAIGLTAVLILFRNRIGGVPNTAATDLSTAPTSAYATT